ncbi:MAG: SDR family oxidoreductase [Acidimicrobiales bacterium]|nr:SDR family oxidoreductase [Acidimicrobiales bacterium]MDP6901942.1 SDR family oxidoreductase [Acidimicrobiales bacterium]HJL98328.1 SDR family oxidoreductase [Acidimicrobiales bacterium]
MTVDPYSSWTDDELATLAHGFRDDLYQGQVALVTGGAGGIGRAICMLLGRLGARIVTCGRDEHKLEQLRKSLETQGIDVVTTQANVRDPEQVASLFEKIWEKFDRLDLVVNNAGGQFAAPASDISPKGWAAVVETNLYGPWYVMQKAAQTWIERERAGSIVNIGTITGRASVGIPHTAAARAGAESLSASLSVEWAPHQIRVNTVAVGVVRSPGLVNYPNEARPSFDHNPQRRLGDVQDVAQAVAFLGSPAMASFVTGETFHVAGGEQVWGEYWALGKPDYFRVVDTPESQ